MKNISALSKNRERSRIGDATLVKSEYLCYNRKMIKDSIEFDPQHRYSVLRLDDEHMLELERLLKKCLAEICYGKGSVNMEPDEYTYHKACHHIHEQLIDANSVRRGAIVAEMIMHLLAPIMIEFDIEPLSVLLSLQDKNIKHGFDINFLNLQNSMIWYGEVKSGNDKKRQKLIDRAHKDLTGYFDNVGAKGKKSTSYKWDAAKNEIRVIYAGEGEKLEQILRLFSESKAGILAGQGGKRNALIMAVNFGKADFPPDHSDIAKYLDKKIDKEHHFDNCIVLSVAKEQINDIISFLKQEGISNVEETAIY